MSLSNQRASVRRTMASYSQPIDECQRSSGYTLGKYLVRNPDLCCFSLWIMVVNTHDTFALEIMQYMYMLSGLSYHGIHYFTRWWTNWDFSTGWFHTLVISFAHTEVPATTANTQVSSLCLCWDISIWHVICSMCGHFVFVASLVNHTLQELVINNANKHHLFTWLLPCCAGLQFH